MFALATLLLAASASAQPAYFKGEDCARCHSLIRDAARPKPAADAKVERHDVIVVGGGVAGLSAAYYLKDRDVLVLEKEDAVGGKVRRDSWGRARYPVAAGYMAQVYLPQIADLFRDLGLKPVTIPEPGNEFIDPSLKKSLAALAADMAALSTGTALGQVPPVPETPSAYQKGLDKRSFYEYIASKYGSAAGAFAERYARSLFGTSAKDVSAWTGLVFLSADFGQTQNITWDGGPGVISEGLAEKIGRQRIRTGTVVLSVTQDKEGATVVFERAGVRGTARAGKVVMAVPGFIARRLIAELPKWKDDALRRVRYSAYAIAIIAAKEPLYRKSFDLWSTTSTVFTDLEPADWGRAPPEPGADTPAQVLEAFVPLGENDGRAKLLRSNDEQLAARVADGLESILPGAKAKLHGIRIIRWGHAMPIDYPGYLTGVRADVERTVGNIVFAGVDTQMPCIEGALVSGWKAAQAIK